MIAIRLALLAAAMIAAPLGSFAWASEVIPLDDFRSKAILGSATTRPEIWSVVTHIFESYETQRTQAYCGVASTVIVLNSLGVPGDHYVSEWFPFLTMSQSSVFSKEFLSVKAPSKINIEGLTLDQLGAAIGSNRYVRATTYHATPELGYEGFRKILIAALTDPESRVIANYLRSKLNQIGAGHHSPLAAYDSQTDRVLVMDTARYKNGKTDGGLKDGSGQPVWITVEDLWSAANTEDQIDKDTRLFRGIVVITKKSPKEIRADRIREAKDFLRREGELPDKDTLDNDAR